MKHSMLLVCVLMVSGCMVGEPDDESAADRSRSFDDEYGGEQVTETWHQWGYVCFEDYSCYLNARTTCYSDGSCLYQESPPPGYVGASAYKLSDGSPWQLVTASNCDKWCRYLMASTPDNVSRWNIEPNAQTYNQALPEECLVYGHCMGVEYDRP